MKRFIGMMALAMLGSSCNHQDPMEAMYKTMEHISVGSDITYKETDSLAIQLDVYTRQQNWEKSPGRSCQKSISLL